MNELIFLRRPGAEVGEQREYHSTFEVEPFDLHGRHHEVTDAEAEVTVTRLSDGVHLDLEVRATVRTTCDRTLQPVELPMRFGDSEFVSRPDDEELAVKDWMLDVPGYARRALPTEIPMQVFAPGTEPVRPADEEEELDPRWSGLRGLFGTER